MKIPSLRAGFALVEVLIALLLTAGALLAAMPLFALMAHGNVLAWQRAVAAQLAQQKLEDLQAFSRLSIGDAGDPAFDAIATDHGGLHLAAGPQTRGGQTYDLSWRVQDLDACTAAAAPGSSACSEHPRAALKSVSLRVEWRDSRDDLQGFDLQSDIPALHPDLAATALIRRPQLLPPQP